MKASELAKVLAATPDLNVTYLDEWGVITVTGIRVVKIEDGVSYDNDDIALKRQALKDLEIVSPKEFDAWTIKSLYESYQDYVSQSKAFIESEIELLAKLDAAPYSILLK